MLLPLAKGDLVAPVQGAPAVARPPTAGGAILIADDDPDVLKLVDRILSTAGYQTLCASNGHDAVITFHEHKAEISMVILDLIMPVMDGREAAAKIRELSDAVYILFLSGFVPGEDTDDLAGEPLLRKPFKSADLLARVAHSTGESQGTKGPVADRER